MYTEGMLYYVHSMPKMFVDTWTPITPICSFRNCILINFDYFIYHFYCIGCLCMLWH